MPSPITLEKNLPEFLPVKSDAFAFAEHQALRSSDIVAVVVDRGVVMVVLSRCHRCRAAAVGNDGGAER
jgi:hypothetical protein